MIASLSLSFSLAAAMAGAGPSPRLASVLVAHNRLRAKHHAPPLSWSPKLAEVAQSWADSLRDRGCVLEHSKKHRLGENLSVATLGFLDGSGLVEGWYREIAKYDFVRGAFSHETGHFTQLVWVGTKRVGCAVSRCRDLEVWVCNYDPPGNVIGQFVRNVRPAKRGVR